MGDLIALILGNGPHFYRYFDALCFQHRIHEILTEIPESLEKVDLVCVTEPYSVFSQPIHMLDKLSDNTFVLVEKMPTILENELNVLLRICDRHKLFFMNSRLHTRMERVITQNDCVIYWPCGEGNDIDPIYHVLPNAIDFYIQQTGDNIDVGDIESLSEDPFSFVINKGARKTVFYIGQQHDGNVIVNNKPIMWPNQFETYSRMIENILSGVENIENNHNHIKNEMKIIHKILMKG